MNAESKQQAGICEEGNLNRSGIKQYYKKKKWNNFHYYSNIITSNLLFQLIWMKNWALWF